MEREILFSPVSVDFGARKTGVLCASAYRDNEEVIRFRGQLGRVIDVELAGKSPGITFLQKSRTSDRHRIRTQKRRRMVKRLLRCYFVSRGIDPGSYRREMEFINGLLNRRGYTFVDDSLRKSLEKDLAKPGLAEAARVALKDLNAPKLENYSDILEYLLVELPETEETILEGFGEKISSNTPAEGEKDAGEIDCKTVLWEYITEVLHQKRSSAGNRHRKMYFEEIKSDLQGAEEYWRKKYGKIACLLDKLLFRAGFDNRDDFARFIGHISNLQLRVVRKYFNGVREDSWKEERLKKFISNWIISWHCKNPEDRKRRRSLLRKLNASSSLKEWFCGLDPVETIPPYEDQNNRRPPKCRTLYLNPTGLDSVFPEWERVLKKVLDSHPHRESLVSFDSVSGNSVEEARVKGNYIDKSEKRQERQKYARILQRILDLSKQHDIYAIREQVEGRTGKSDERDMSSAERELLAALGSDEGLRDQFVEFARKYYWELDRAKRGMWVWGESMQAAKSNLFFRCELNPPHKSKVSYRHINSLLGGSLSSMKDVEDFRKGVWASKISETGKSSSYKALAEKVEEIRKKYGNRFRDEFVQVYKAIMRCDAKSKDSEELFKLVESIQKGGLKRENGCGYYFDRLKKAAGGVPKSDSDPKAIEIAGDLYIMAQLYQILEKDRNGFSRDCRGCIAETEWRMQIPPSRWQNGERLATAMATRLCNDSVVPFDGFLGRYVDRVAREIAEVKWEQLKEEVKSSPDFRCYVPIVIEQNQFEFEETLNAQKGNSKKKSAPGKGSRALSKEDRIKRAGHGLCPYCGKSIGKGSGDLDHILPRSFTLSKYGTVFNGEGNLIYTHRGCNQTSKGDNDYSFKNLDLDYLKKVFPEYGETRKQIEHKVTSCANSLLSKDRPVNFVVLSDREQDCIRHALFVDDSFLQKQIVSKVLNTRIRTMVNGTQRYLAKRIGYELGLRARKVGAEIYCYPFLVPVSDEDWMYYDSLPAGAEPQNLAMEKARLLLHGGCSVSATRRLLALENEKYRKADKDKPQENYSHVIDASMAMASLLRNSETLMELFRRGQCLERKEGRDVARAIAKAYNDGEGVKLIEQLVPKRENCEDREVKRRRIVDGSKIWQRAVFKETIYGERFYPLILDRDEALSYGYVDPNGLRERVAFLKAGGKNPRYSFELLSGFFKAPYTGASWDEAMKELSDSGKERIFFVMDKSRVFQFYEDLFYSRNDYNLLDITKDTKARLTCLETLRYLYIRRDVAGFATGYSRPAGTRLDALYQTPRHKRVLVRIRKISQEMFRKRTMLNKLGYEFLKEKPRFDSGWNKDAKNDWEGWLKRNNQDCTITFPNELLSKGGKKILTEEKIDKALTAMCEESQKIEQYFLKKIREAEGGNTPEKEEKKMNTLKSKLTNNYNPEYNASYLEEQSDREDNPGYRRCHRRHPSRYTVQVAPSIPATHVRIRRRAPAGGWIYQVQCSSVLDLGKDEKTNRSVLLWELSKQENMVPAVQGWWEKWLPYREGLRIKQGGKRSIPVPESLKPKIEKIQYNPRKSQDKSWITLYLDDERFKIFSKEVRDPSNGKEEAEGSTKEEVLQSKLLKYLGAKEKGKQKNPEEPPQRQPQIEINLERSSNGSRLIRFKAVNAALRGWVESLDGDSGVQSRGEPSE